MCELQLKYQSEHHTFQWAFLFIALSSVDVVKEYMAWEDKTSPSIWVLWEARQIYFD